MDIFYKGSNCWECVQWWGLGKWTQDIDTLACILSINNGCFLALNICYSLKIENKYDNK